MARKNITMRSRDDIDGEVGNLVKRHQANGPKHFIQLSADQNLLADLEMLDEIWNPPPNAYADNPVGWVHEVAHEETWSKQREIMESVRDNRYTAVKSCHGPGKSFTASRVVCWWMDTQPDAFAITSAPTSHQVRTILWREIRRGKKAANLPGKISQGQVPEWKDPTGEIIGFGRKPADYLDPMEAAAAFQGLHADSLLVVLDEGSGIPQWLADACENLITGTAGRLLIIGNPDNPLSYFAKAFRPGSGFNTITIKAEDTPAFTGEPVSERLLDRLTSKVWVEERAKRWGKNSPMYKSKVDAEFSEITDDTVFTPSMISDAVVNDRSKHATVRGRLGYDVARLGADENVVYHNRNGYVRLVARWAKVDTMESVGRYRRLVNDDRRGAPPTHIDATGLGAGVYDRLRELEFPVIPFNGGDKAHNPLKYKNRRAEAYWDAREMFEAGLIDLEPEDEDLQAELMEVHFKLDSNGRIQIESKDDISDRLGRSPDRADGFVYSLQKDAVLSDPGDEPADEPAIVQDEVITALSERSGVSSSNRPQTVSDLEDNNDLMEIKF